MIDSAGRAGPLPNLVMSGVTKAGTTSLHAYLSQHREVFAPTAKELNYFSPLLYGRSPAGLETYARHFVAAGTEKWRLDSSPFYFVGGARTARAVAGALDRPRVLISLRDPVARLWSSYTYKRSKGHVEADQSFTQFVDRCLVLYGDNRDLDEANAQHLTLRTGIYAEFLPAWIEEFGADLRIVYAEDLARDPGAVMGGVFGWLGVDPMKGALDVTPRNVTMQSRSLRLRRLAYGANARVKPLLPASTQHRLKRLYARVNAAAPIPEMAASDRSRLRDFYAEHSVTLADVLRGARVSHLPDWLTDLTA